MILAFAGMYVVTMVMLTCYHGRDEADSGGATPADSVGEYEPRGIHPQHECSVCCNLETPGEGHTRKVPSDEISLWQPELGVSPQKKIISYNKLM